MDVTNAPPPSLATEPEPILYLDTTEAKGTNIVLGSNRIYIKGLIAELTTGLIIVSVKLFTARYLNNNE